MAVEGPDPKTLRTSEEAFKHPVATVRGVERQLRNDIETNRERLRTLVGYNENSNYLVLILCCIWHDEYADFRLFS